MLPLRKYDITVVRMDRTTPDKKWYDKIGEIIVWPTNTGGERLQTRLFMFPELDLGTFEQKPRESGIPTPDPDAPINIDDIPF